MTTEIAEVRERLRSPTSVHIIGIGGAGMGAIAEVLHGMGHEVSGSDMNQSAVLDRLQALGIRAEVGHSPANLERPDGSHPEIVARSTAVPDANVEVMAVRERGGRVLRRAELLGAITSLHRAVAVAGTHGKTTTSSMLAIMALRAGADPSYIIGGQVTELGTGAAAGSGEWFIVEADESDGTFLELGHTIGLVTNVEPDHLEFYGGEPQMRAAFERFIEESRIAVVCVDDEGAARFRHGSNVVTYGQDESATYQIRNLIRSPGGTSFEFVRAGAMLGRVDVPMPGLHNARNAAGAAATALEMGLSFAAVRAAIGEFAGVGRRFHHRGEAGGVTFIDDYAHLPTEVSSALDAATDLDADRVVAVFQPHRYSRTESLWQDFTGAFDHADLLVVTGIYSSGEAPREGVTGDLVVRAVEAGATAPPILYHADRDSLAEFVASVLQPGDVCMTLGAGDSVNLPDELIELMAESKG